MNKNLTTSPADCKVLLTLNTKISSLRSRLKNKKLSLKHKELIKDAVNQLKNKKEIIYKKFQLMNLLKMHSQIMNNYY
jgi:inactivated superfamily I helicase